MTFATQRAPFPFKHLTVFLLGTYLMKQGFHLPSRPMDSRKRGLCSDSMAGSSNPKKRRPTATSVFLQEIDGSHTGTSSSSSHLASAERAHEFEVFLSFRGVDNRKTFTDCLYHSLQDAGIGTFRDSEKLHIGREISPALMKAIQQSKICIPIFSKGYASSKWCLEEVLEMVKSMKGTNRKMIMPIFLDVMPDEVQHQTGRFYEAFSRHMRRYEPVTVQRWRDALKEVVKLKGLELDKVANGNQGEFIKFVVARVLHELKKACLNMGEILVGIDDRVEAVTKLLEVSVEDVRMVGIWGMGGIGKTTLAKVIFNKLVDQYESCCFLNDIRETSRSKGLPSLQRKLASDILRFEHKDFDNDGEGVNVLRSRLRGKKSLILLDDVDAISQLKVLVGDIAWFGLGSRIIITTREKNVLDQFKIKYTYQVELLDEDWALELFSKHAFGDALPTTDFLDLSWDLVEITGRLPLALEVIGSSLSVHRRRKDIWESTVKQLQLAPHVEVETSLKISYDSLDHRQKEIFLDIACFFSGTDVRDVIPMWEDCKLFPAVGIEILKLKSLIKIVDGNKIWMHDQLIDLGRHIVEQENYKEPALRSRLWRCKEAAEVLMEQQGTSKVEAIAISHEEASPIVKEDCLRSEFFINLPKLRSLQLVGIGLDGNFQRLLPELRLLRWSWYNVSLPAYLQRNNLVVLDLSCSLVDEDWNGWTSIKVVKLKVLKLSYCPELRTIPDFSAFPALERLVLDFCLNLVSVDQSIGLLKNLNFLDMRKCRSLKKLPEQLGSMEALNELLIDETSVQEIPISTGMKKLEILSANRCKNLNQIPDSVGSLVRLKRLSLEGCCSLKELPDSIGQLNSLLELRLGNSGIKCLPATLGTAEKLELLDVSWCSLPDGEVPREVEIVVRVRRFGRRSVKILPPSISSLSRCRALHRKGRWSLHTLPALPSSLTSLKVEGSAMLTFPDLSNLIHLKELYLLGDFNLKEECLAKLRKLVKLVLKSVNIITLPKEIVAFSQLEDIDISYCRELKCLPKLPLGLCRLRICHCSSLQRLPSLSNLSDLSELCIDCCTMLMEIDGLYNLVSLQILLLRDFPELSKLKNLHQADLDHRKLFEIQGLNNLHKLQLMNFSNWTLLRRLPELSGLESLVELNICRCKAIESTPDLSVLKSLKNLKTEGCENLCRLNGLEELGSLELLSINGCMAMVKLPNLSRLQRLRDLKMEACDKLHWIEGLEELTSLRILDMSGCKAIESLPDLSKLQRSRELKMRACEKLRRLEGLGDLESLEILDISGCTAIERLPNLSRLRRLRDLRVGACGKLHQLEGLEELELLEVLDVSGCKAIDKLPDLSKLKSLRSLVMEDCENIREVWGLEELSDLEALWISGCKALELPDLSSLQGVLTIE